VKYGYRQSSDYHIPPLCDSLYIFVQGVKLDYRRLCAFDPAIPPMMPGAERRFFWRKCGSYALQKIDRRIILYKTILDIYNLIE
jgi:hypothetical protein